MDTEAVNGGAACHWGGPAAFAEIMAAIHGIMFATKGRQWHEAFNFVNDAGHAENGIYALRCNYGFDGMTFEDLKGFRSIRSKLTGHGESHLNPQGVLLSNGPLGSALAQSQGLAMADKVRKNDRVTVCAVSDGASMEGEAREAFAAIPGLAAKDRLNPYLLLLSDNDTKLSGRISQDAFSMAPSFSAMSALGWNVIKVQDGHDLQAVYLAVENGLAQARANPRAPVCLWVKTIKGYGVKATMESPSGGHGFPLSNGEKIADFVNEIYFGAEVPADLAAWALALRRGWEQKEAAKKAGPAAAPAVKKDKTQSGLARGAVRAAREGLPVYSISSDVQGSTGMGLFQKSFPDRFVEANPNAPENIPDKTHNFSDRNQQVAQEKPTPNGKSDMPALTGRKDIESNQIVTGQLSPPQQDLPTPPPMPPSPQVASVVTPRRQQDPLPGFEKKEGDSLDGFGSNLAKPSPNAQPVPDRVEGERDAPLIENVAAGAPRIDPRHPQPRRSLEAHVRPAIFKDNQFGTQNVGITALDSRFSNYGVYLHRLLEAVQLNWYAILDQSRISPASGSQVAVRFKLNSKGDVSAIIDIVPTSGTSEQGTRACARAITIGAPYGEWSEDMKAVLGEEQELQINFLYL